jgi:glucose/mannose transport system substrate-binding protein
MSARRAVAVAVAVAVAALALALAACGDDAPTSATKDTKQLEVVSWWTSGSEAAALDALFTAFRNANPGVDAINGAVPGGAGSKAIVELAKRLQDDNPPDVWQTFAGKSVQGYASRGVIRSVASVFDSENLRTRLQPTVLRSVIRDGSPYGVPTGAHRSNVLWFNKKLLADAGVSPPTSAYTLAAFQADLEKVEAAGATPLCLGAKDRFTTVELFESTLLSSIGISGWKDMVGDDLDWHGDRVKSALKRFGDMLRFSDPRASGLTWDEATKKLANGGCAFESMNDSAFGELIAAGAKEDEDFGSTAFPGTGDAFLAVIDVFVAAKKAKNAKNALAFLGDINKPATQLAFNRSKGSVPVLDDIDVSSLTAYQRAASKTFWGSPVLLSIAHGEAMSPEFQEGFYEAVSTYVRTRDANEFADELEDAVSKDRIPQR